MPASPAGTAPQAWPIVLRLALTARPALAASGLAAVLRGKKLRAWNRLCLAAAQHPKHYAMWIKAAEPARFKREQSALRACWNTSTVVDPHHSLLFRRQSERCLLAF
jgi:hypothetical protein